ncbi:MAG: 16S rRNA (cytosine(1402)-N(4))-methyltransferase RsmH [Deltaproteobacteria bacterium]|nr:16S rRNA (cytosine(1402)-N(4))-methyltransferase RsmH [Deltaproteobacteria bacterium]
MQEELVRLVVEHAPQTLLDCTVGGGGHARALLEALPEARLVGVDRDPEAVAAARANLARFGARARVVHGRMRDVVRGSLGAGLSGVSAIIADLGVSSHQLDSVNRGFSFRGDAALDMRMDPTSGTTAAEVLSSMPEADLAAAIRTLGEERFARRVARAVKEALPKTTRELAQVVRRVVRPSRDGLDPATRTFQALRMLVNEELLELDALMRAAPDLLVPGGVMAVLSFHSLEDRAVKTAFAAGVRGCICPPNLPVCACGRVPTLRLLTRKPLRPRAAEVAHNPRARSARLRAALRLPAASSGGSR